MKALITTRYPSGRMVSTVHQTTPSPPRPGPDGKTLMVAVVHVDGRMYECVVRAKRREGLLEWFGRPAAVLGHYRPTG